MTYGTVEGLDRAECVALLEDRGVGRVAVTVAALPAVWPVSYRFVGERILFFVPADSEFARALSGAIVAFQVDDVDPPGRGWNVQVVGPAWISGDPADLRAAAAAGLRPWRTGDADHALAVVQAEIIHGRRLALRTDVAPVPVGAEEMGAIGGGGSSG